MGDLEYRTIDAEEAAERVLRDSALAAHKDAYTLAVEVERLEELYAASKDAAFRKAVREQIGSAKSQAAAARAKASRKAARIGGLPLAVRRETEQEWLTTWLTSLERSHAETSAKLREREATLAMKKGTANAPTDDERELLTQTVKIDRASLDGLEASWRVATRRLDGLQPRKQSATKQPAAKKKAAARRARKR
jgi:hypothetical protein